ncbi:hypothetical protein LQZ18_14990 [Lachnospiraceae bacterium ZAX-1]
MSIQDKTERILKEIHVLFSKSDVYGNDPDNIIINKREMFDLLEKLNGCMYEMMDQYEVLQQSRELGQRKVEKKGEAIIEMALKRAEDVYAASFIYTDDALSQIQNIMADAAGSVQKIFEYMNETMNKEKEQVFVNQTELREQLKDFTDTNKYMLIIEERNKEREKESEQKEVKEQEKKIRNEAKHYPMSAKPEMKVNAAYFERHGIPILEESKKSPEKESQNGKQKHGNVIEAEDIPEVKIDLDAEYFKWKSGAGERDDTKKKAGERKERKLLFGRKSW